MENFGILGIIPPFLTILLSFITKDVIVSLFLGIFAGCLIVCRGNVFTAILHLTDKIAESLADGWNIRILLFCLLLGGLVGLMVNTGATNAFANWAKNKIKNRKTCLVMAWFCGIIIFIDDYFNSLAVGTIMRPVTDKFNVSRAKLSYILDSTAAPVCIIAPISSWVVTVMSLVKGADGFDALNMNEFSFFIKSIPYNIYALLTIFTVLYFCLTERDFGPMKASENLARQGQFFNPEYVEMGSEEGKNEIKENDRAKIYDMLIPLAVLVFVCIVMFPLTTYLMNIDGENIVSLKQSMASMSVGYAFNNTDASMALFYSIIITLVFSYIYYIARGLFNISGASNALIEGLKTMMSACMILTLAWTIGGIIKSSPADGGLGLSSYLAHVFVDGHFPIGILPILVFLFSALIGFSTGTSWGTFSIMIPITFPIVVGLAQSSGLSQATLNNEAFFCISAILSGAVFGDHASPISDSTILSSTSASCPHLEHVSTQVVYAGTVAGSVGVGYLVGGFLGLSLPIAWVFSVASLAAALYFFPRLSFKFK